jgi:two-component sensor histidine kinase
MLTPTPSKDAPLIDIPEGIALALSHAIIDTVRDPLLVLDLNQRIVAASRSFYLTFKLAGHDLRGQVIFDIEGGQWDIPELRELLETIAKDRATIEGYEVDREFPVIGRRIMLLNVRKVFYEEDAHGTVLLAFEDITHRRAVERQVQELMKEKDMLLEELQHRVANSLQIIASILLIKARTVQSEETRLQLEDAHKRVLSVAAVQKHLHATGHGRSIEVGTYLTKLCETLAESMIGDSRPISLKVVADQGTVMSNQAVSIGLIVTELVMNSLKHAFPGERPDAAILVTYKAADTDWKLTISDNGIGKPDPGIGRKKTEGGLGTSLVQALTRQLDAQLDTASDTHGTVMSITHATFKSKPSKAEPRHPADVASTSVQ